MKYRILMGMMTILLLNSIVTSYLTVDLGTDLVVTSNYSSSTYYKATIDVSEGLLIFNSTYENSTYQISGSAITYDVISNTNVSLIIAIPETRSNFTFNPTNIIENQTTVRFNTTDASWFGQQTVTATQAYLNEPNLTKVTVTFPSILNKYDLFGLNLTSYLGWNPANILNVWYGSYTGNTDNSTKKDTNDYASWQDTCAYGNTTGMVGCWNFNEGQGVTAKDRANNSQNNNDGTLTNMNIGIDNGTSGWTSSGKFGKAIQFDGVNDVVSIPQDDSLYNTIYTISTWVRGDEAVDLSEITQIYTYGDTYSLAWRHTSDNFDKACALKSSTTWYSSGSATQTLNVGEWYNIVCRYDNQDLVIFINGVIGANNSIGSRVPIVDTDNLFISGGGKFNGTIDEVKIYNRALSASEILDQYNMKKDYFDSMYNEEGSSLAASSEWDLIVQNGTVSTCAYPNITTAINSDWTVNDKCTKSDTTINLGTGKLKIGTNGLLKLNNTNIFSTGFEMFGSGQKINIFSGNLSII